MKLILHAGTHKTGTTSIQKVLHDNRGWLQERGVFCPDGGGLFSDVRPHHQFARAVAKGRFRDRRKVAKYLKYAQRKAGSAGTIIISSEPVYRLVSGDDTENAWIVPDYWERRGRYLRRLSKVLSGFDVEVILCFREYAYFLRWLHRKLSRKGVVAEPFADFRIKYGDRFKYDRQLEVFQRHFDKIRTFRYEDATEAGLISYFFRTIGFPMPEGADNVWVRRTPNGQRRRLHRKNHGKND